MSGIEALMPFADQRGGVASVVQDMYDVAVLLPVFLQKAGDCDVDLFVILSWETTVDVLVLSVDDDKDGVFDRCCRIGDSNDLAKRRGWHLGWLVWKN